MKFELATLMGKTYNEYCYSKSLIPMLMVHYQCSLSNTWIPISYFYTPTHVWSLMYKFSNMGLPRKKSMLIFFFGWGMGFFFWGEIGPASSNSHPRCTCFLRGRNFATWTAPSGSYWRSTNPDWVLIVQSSYFILFYFCTVAIV